MLYRVSIGCLLILFSCGVVVAGDAHGIWLDVPFVKQEKDGCGAASIAMVMQYWRQRQGRAVSPDAEYGQIEHALLTRGAHGIYASDLERYFKQSGYAAFSFSGDLETLKHHLEKGRPLIVAVKPGRLAPRHYEVVVGLDQAGQFVLLNDPEQRKLLKEDYSRFEREWKAAGQWTLLAVPETTSH